MATPMPDGFVLKPVANRTVGALTGSRTLGLVLHVQAGNGGLSGWFNNPAAQASSTWWAGKAGEREQYGNPDTDKFWAQAAGNSTYHSIETEGQPSEPLTDAQIETVAQAFAWGHLRYDWPLVLAETPGQPGLGWHGMGGSAWGGHTGCPGDVRKGQRAQILARAKQIASLKEDDMAAADVQAINAYTRALLLDGYTVGGVQKPALLDVLVETQRRVTAVTEGLKALAATLPADAAQKVVDSLNATYEADVVLKPKA